MARSGKALDLSGRYELDRDKSESLYTHMSAMGCEEIAALASEKLNLRVNVVMTDESVQFWQTSQLGTTYRKLVYGKETPETGVALERRALARIVGNSLVIVTRWDRGVITDRREMKPDANVMINVLELSVQGHSKPIRTVRYFKRTGDPDPEVIKTKPGASS